jgi:hypothetical protein
MRFPHFKIYYQKRLMLFCRNISEISSFHFKSFILYAHKKITMDVIFIMIAATISLNRCETFVFVNFLNFPLSNIHFMN